MSANNFGRRNIVANFAEPRSPLATDDNKAGVAQGSIWFNTSSGLASVCISDATNAAVWQPMLGTGGNVSLGYLLGADMNATTDQPLLWNVGAGVKVQISSIVAVNPSVSMTTAAGGVYPTTAKGGTAIVAAAQVYTALTGAGTVEALTLAGTVPATVYTVGANAAVLSLTTPQGAPATADFYLYGNILPTG
jgi:hypothetical protein